MLDVMKKMSQRNNGSGDDGEVFEAHPHFLCVVVGVQQHLNCFLQFVQQVFVVWHESFLFEGHSNERCAFF